MINSGWVFTVKQGPNQEDQFKARCVAKGCGQKEDVDYDQTFSPTPSFDGVRVGVQTMVQEEMEIHQMDFCSAYLNADLDKVVYMKQPPRI